MKSPLTGMRVKEGIRVYFQSVASHTKRQRMVAIQIFEKPLVLSGQPRTWKPLGSMFSMSTFISWEVSRVAAVSHCPRVVQGDNHIQSAATNTIIVTDASCYSPASGSPHTWEAFTFILFAVEVWHDSGQKTMAYSPGDNHISSPSSAKWTRQLGDSNTYLYTEQGHFT